jgi:hypothetical protein
LSRDYPEIIYADGFTGSNGIHCLDYKNFPENVKYIRADCVGEKFTSTNSASRAIALLEEALNQPVLRRHVDPHTWLRDRVRGALDILIEQQ